MQKHLANITEMFKKNNFNDLDNASQEMKMVYLYGLYHYYYGDEDSILDVKEHTKYTKEFNNYVQACYEEDGFEDKTLSLLVPHYINNGENLDKNLIKSIIIKVQGLIGDMKNNYYDLVAQNNILRDFWDSSSDDKLIIRIITNAVLDYDEKNSMIDIVTNMTPISENIKFDIVFGDDIIDEITQLTSDKKCVDVSELLLEREGNFLTYGEEESIITNIMASSLKENYNKYGKAGLFAMNLRFYIPNKKVDAGLEESIKEKGENFWYYNNGIIIVCDDYEIVGNKIKLWNFSIVNGGQTTRMIGVIPFSKDFAISCKIIRNKYKDNKEANVRFVSEIAEASNTQKPINSTDIVANRSEQRLLKDNLAEAGIFVQIKKGDAAAANLKENYPEPWQKTKNDEIGQLLYAAVYQKPGTARNAKEKIFSDKNKYEMVFGKYNNEKYSPELIKDILILRSHFKKWAAEVAKAKDDEVDETKKGLVKNGTFYFMASIMLMIKFANSKELTDKLKNIGIASEKGTYVISQRLFNHRLFNDDYEALKNRMYSLFELVYQKYISREFMRAKESKPELVYSNFTKTDKNYLSMIAPVIYDDFAEGISPRVESVISSLLYKENPIDKEETLTLVEEAFENYGKKPEESIEEVDLIAEELEEKLKAFRSETYQREGIKAYSVFTNVEMKNIIALRPKTIGELMRACFKTYPKTKAKRYGNAILEIVKSVCGE